MKRDRIQPEPDEEGVLLDGELINDVTEKAEKNEEERI